VSNINSSLEAKVQDRSSNEATAAGVASCYAMLARAMLIFYCKNSCGIPAVTYVVLRSLRFRAKIQGGFLYTCT